MKAWDDAWQTEEARAYWLRPDPFVVSLLPRFGSEGLEKALDLGFGLGRHAVLMAKEGFDVYGVDTSAAGAEYAREWSQREKATLRLLIGEMSHLPFAGEFFDVILAWNVIYHGTAERIRQTVGEIKRCLKTSGYLLCTLISTRHSKCGLGEEIERGTFVVAEEAEKSYPHHYFDREEINSYLAGFDLLTCEEVQESGPGNYHWNILARLV